VWLLTSCSRQMNFAAPRVSRIVPGAERDDVYLNRYHAALHRARAVKAGATEAQVGESMRCRPRQSYPN
jgi:hypothetical protein